MQEGESPVQEDVVGVYSQHQGHGSCSEPFRASHKREQPSIEVREVTHSAKTISEALLSGVSMSLLP